ncbi:hypothetical protein A9Q81_13605 [Gammaproteobacteria bacterium 42_54_T18]|nr:hypothetical protein A9Q81_13605 [Gammaproteobacteria bacterium 42_54_T18]
MDKLSLTTQDGQNIGCQYFPCDKPGTPTLATLVIASAIGVPQGFYRRYAEYMSQQGFACLTFDYRGTGDSTYRGNLNNIAMTDWGTQDLDCVLAKAEQLTEQNDGNDNPVLLLGHSIGGQISGFAQNSKNVKAAIFVASSAPYWKRWNGFSKLSMFLTVYLLLPICSMGRKVFPAKSVGFSSMNFPAVIAKTWAGWMKKKDYLFDESLGYSLENYQQLSFPLLSLSFDDDTLAPEININWLLKFFPNCQVERRSIQAKTYGALGHMGFFRKKNKDTLWRDSVQWFSQQLDHVDNQQLDQK